MPLFWVFKKQSNAILETLKIIQFVWTFGCLIQHFWVFKKQSNAVLGALRTIKVVWSFGYLIPHFWGFKKQANSVLEILKIVQIIVIYFSDFLTEENHCKKLLFRPFLVIFLPKKLKFRREVLIVSIS